MSGSPTDFAQAAVHTSTQTALPLISLQFLSLAPSNASVFIGLGFGVAGLATVIASIAFSRVVDRFGYRQVAMAGAAAGAALLVIATASSVVVVIAALTVLGLTRGVLVPAIPSMIGLESPRDVDATAFGAGASALAVGLVAGPLIGGGVAALASASMAMASHLLFRCCSPLSLLFWVREPAAYLPTAAKNDQPSAGVPQFLRRAGRCCRKKPSGLHVVLDNSSTQPPRSTNEAA